MRNLLIGVALLLVVGGVAAGWPYRRETLIVEAAANPTGCRLNAENISGWKRPGSRAIGHVERLQDPTLIAITVGECPGAPGGQPARVKLVESAFPDDTHCAERGYCYDTLPDELTLDAPPKHYRLKVRVRAGESDVPIDILVRRRLEWRSATWDGLMSA